jgi:hypothetical protein
MSDPRDSLPPAFGLVDTDGAEHGLFSIETWSGGTCRLTLVARTERGYPRRELASIPAAVWKQVALAAQKELLRGMVPEEQGPKTSTLKTGDNALSPLIARELAVLLWSLMEDGDGTHIDALLAGWRQLAREERWWLFARASNPTQRQGQGWRRALYFALTDPADTRTAPRLLEIMEAATGQKKTSWPSHPVNYRETLAKNGRQEKEPAKQPTKQSVLPAPKSGRKSTATKATKTAARTTRRVEPNS